MASDASTLSAQATPAFTAIIDQSPRPAVFANIAFFLRIVHQAGGSSSGGVPGSSMCASSVHASVSASTSPSARSDAGTQSYRQPISGVPAEQPGTRTPTSASHRTAPPASTVPAERGSAELS